MKRLSKSKAQNFAILIFKYIILTGLAFVILYPMIIKLSLAFMNFEDIRDATVRFIPKNFTLRNFILAAKNMGYFTSLFETIIHVVAISSIQVFFAMLTAYGFACFKFPGRGLLFAMVLVTLIIPPQVITVPLFLNLKSFDIFGIFKLLTGETISLTGSPIPLYLMAATGLGLKNGLLIFIFRQFFKNFPKELEESASIDGAGVFRTFISIVVPSALPMILTAFLFSVVWQWTDTFYTSTFMPTNHLLATELELFTSQLSNVAEGSVIEAKYSVSLQNNAAILLVMAPILILFFVCQRYFVESIERTGLVG